MIKINGKIIRIGNFPDGTLLIKEEPSYDNADISWFFESNDELVALVYIVQHLRSHGVEEIRLYMPYIPNARQDRVKTADDVFTLKYFAWVINSLKFDEVRVLDPHSYVSEALINNIKVESPESLIMGVYKLVSSKDMNPENRETVMFYPDEGAKKRYSDMLRLPYSFGIKERDWYTGKIKGLSVSGDVSRDNDVLCAGGGGCVSVRGCNVLIVDDICSKGGTFYHSAHKLKELGAEKIFLYVTHCENSIFDGMLLASGLIDMVYTTNSLFTKKHERITVIELR